MGVGGAGEEGERGVKVEGEKGGEEGVMAGLGGGTGLARRCQVPPCASFSAPAFIFLVVYCTCILITCQGLY